MSNPFDYFDKIVCICSKTEVQRKKNASLQFKKIHISHRVDFFEEIVETNKLKKKFGDIASWSKTDFCHYEVIRHAKEEGVKNLFIFESDIELLNTNLVEIQKTVDSLKEVDWTLFYLGGVPHNAIKVHDENLINCTMCQAHAYAVNGKYFDTVLKKLRREKEAIDQVYKKDQKNSIGCRAYSSTKNFVVQKLDENLPRAKLPHRKLVSEYRWKRVIDPVMNLHKKNISWVVSSVGDDKRARMIKSNFLECLRKIEIPTSSGYVKIQNLEEDYKFRKFRMIRDQLQQNKSVLFCDTKVIFLRNCLDDLFRELNFYDIIIQQDGGSLTDFNYIQTILTSDFCLVRPSELTLALFHPRGEGDQILKYDRHDVSFFNNKLNSHAKFTEKLKIKILSDDKYVMSDDFVNTGLEKIVNYNTEDNHSLKLQTIIQNIKNQGHWFIEDE
jgi:hypothetical protein